MIIYLNSQFIESITKRKKLFSFFDKAFLFGSILDSKYFNDIDILLIYQSYSPSIEHEKLKLEKLLLENLKIQVPLHFTILSQTELVQTQFLYKTPQYLRIY